MSPEPAASAGAPPLVAWEHRCSAGFTLRGEHSRPSGRPVIHFVHGTGFCARTYWPLLNLLHRDFDLFLSNVQGHGDSDRGTRFAGWNRTAEVLLEAWQHHAPLFAGVPHLALGHSFGGSISALMIAAAPDQFERALLMDPAMFPPGMLRALTVARLLGVYQHHAVARQTRRRRRHWPSRDAARDYLCERGMFRGWSAEALQAHVDYALGDCDDGGVSLKCAPEHEAQLFGSLPRNFWPALTRVSIPVRLEYSSDGYPFIRRAARHWQKVNPRVQIEAVPGGHCYMQEDERAASLRIRRYFLARAENPA